MPATYSMVIFDVILIQSHGQGLDPLFLLHDVSREAMHGPTLILNIVIPANNTYSQATNQLTRSILCSSEDVRYSILVYTVCVSAHTVQTHQCYVHISVGKSSKLKEKCTPELTSRMIACLNSYNKAVYLLVTSRLSPLRSTMISIQTT